MPVTLRPDGRVHITLAKKPPKSKALEDEVKARVADDVAAYLANGGEITVIPPGVHGDPCHRGGRTGTERNLHGTPRNLSTAGPWRTQCRPKAMASMAVSHFRQNDARRCASQ